LYTHLSITHVYTANPHKKQEIYLPSSVVQKCQAHGALMYLSYTLILAFCVSHTSRRIRLCHHLLYLPYYLNILFNSWRCWKEMSKSVWYVAIFTPLYISLNSLFIGFTFGVVEWDLFECFRYMQLNLLLRSFSSYWCQNNLLFLWFSRFFFFLVCLSYFLLHSFSVMQIFCCSTIMRLKKFFKGSFIIISL
jgi:hypothetical protein